jgi:mono/diheme cytochrome c family protein
MKNMVKKILKIVLGVVVAVIVLAAGFYAKAYYSTEARINKVYQVDAQPITITADSAQIAYGARLTVAKGCRDCHGDDLGGKIFINDAPLGLVVAKNLTKGKGGLPVEHTVSDWVLALKHGIRKDGKPLLIMPAHEYTLLTEPDMAAIIAYAQQVPNVDRELPEHSLGPLARILTDMNELPLLPAEMIDHSRPLAKEVKAEVSIEFGKYLTAACQGCHRENMQGGEPIAPGFPVVANISSSGNPGKWTEQQFITTLRTGKTPEGKILNPSEMPWNMTKAYTDTELRAIYMYLQSI